MTAPDSTPSAACSGSNEGCSDPSVIARVYNCGLGGKDNYASDRAAFDEVLALAPKLPVAMAANRAFVGRAVETAAAHGIKQFLDLGSGLPSPDGCSVLDLASRHQPEARVVYVGGQTKYERKGQRPSHSEKFLISGYGGGVPGPR